MANIGFISLGCAKNQVDCEQMMFRVREAGFELLPDPDARNSVGTRVWTYKHLYRMSMKLHEAGIRTCVLLPPMPGVPAGFCGHGRHIDGRKGVVDDVGVYANRG